MSVECFHPVNDYIRYPSKIDDVKTICNKWIELGKRLNWLMQFRITPTNLSIFHLDTIYEFAHENNIGVESCNFINEPAFLRPVTLPLDMRNHAIARLQDWINQNEISGDIVINTRNPNTIRQQLLQDAKSYINYLRDGGDESSSLPNLVSYLKKLESNRKNSILDYLPEYEELLRTAGY